jgi:hypothetical protein
MKKCPVCEKLYDEGMRFCQVDGTPLEDAVLVDPYKTMVARPEDIASMSAEDTGDPPVPAPPGPGDVLEIPPGSDARKTVVATEEEIRREMEASDIGESSHREAGSSGGLAGGLGAPFGRESDRQDQTSPSPFSERSSPWDPPRPEEPKFAEPPSPRFDDLRRFDEPAIPSEWTPPPAPEPAWQNQPIGQNTPFQPPVAGGPNQTLAIVSLVLGIVSIIFCQITGPVAIVLGFMARRKAAERPLEHGGAGLALAGIITGVLGTLFLVLVVLYLIFVFGVVGLSFLGQ